MKKLEIWDISLIKLSTAGFILFIASFWPEWFANLRWIWLIIAILAAIKPVCLFFKK